MSTYNPAVPTGLVNLDEDYLNLQLNFQQADLSFAKDHFAFSDQTANNGFHKQTTFVNEPAPVTIGGQLALYSKGAAGGPSQLFLIRDANAGTEIALTPNPAVVGNIISAQNGYSWLPGSILFQWGFDAIGAVADTIINFPIPFGVAWLPVVNLTQAGNISSGASTMILARTNSNFSVHNNSTIVAVFWMAIGPI